MNGLYWSLGLLGLLLILQRALHGELMAILLLLTRRMNVAMVGFSVLFFPGVLLHEFSHWLTARLLGVRTGRVWLLPERMPDGTLRMGYVEAARTDPLRDSLVGLAPLLLGGAFVAYAGLIRLELHLFWGNLLVLDRAAAATALTHTYQQPDFWLWLYLTFVVSSTMLPSQTDRQAWLPVILFAIVLTGAALGAGAGPWMIAHLAGPLDNALLAVAAVFGISAALHAVLLSPTWMVRRLLNRLTGLQVG